METSVRVMAVLRMVSGSLEWMAALGMLYFGSVPRALQINGLLALVGPFVLVTVTAIGAAHMASHMGIGRIALLLLGVGCILWATRL